MNYLNKNIHFNDIYDGEYSYYVFEVGELDELWLTIEVWSDGYFEVIDPSRVSTNIDETSIKETTIDYLESGFYEIEFKYSVYLEIDGVSIGKSYGYAKVTYSIEELKRLYAQSDNLDFVSLEVEINGQQYTVQVEAYRFPELLE